MYICTFWLSHAYKTVRYYFNFLQFALNPVWEKHHPVYSFSFRVFIILITFVTPVLSVSDQFSNKITLGSLCFLYHFPNFIRKAKQSTMNYIDTDSFVQSGRARIVVKHFSVRALHKVENRCVNLFFKKNNSNIHQFK
jgi:hypothetical protein